MGLKNNYYGHGSTRPHDQIPLNVRVGWHFYFTKYLPENLENTIGDSKKRLSTSFAIRSYCLSLRYPNFQKDVL